MTDLVIGFAANYTWDTIAPFAVSLVRSGFKGKKVLFAQRLTADAADKLRSLGFELLPIPVIEYSDPKITEGGYFAYVARFLLMHRHLYNNPDYRFVVCADTRDVIFQHDPTVWLEKNIGSAGLVAASEYIYHWAQKGNTEWVMHDFKEVDAYMMSQMVYCSGVISGRTEYIRDITMAIYLMGRGICGLTWGADQPAYNALMHQKAYADATLVPTMKDAYCLNLVVVAFEEYRKMLTEAPPPVILGSDSGPVPTQNPAHMWDYDLADIAHFSMIHQYDRMPSLAAQIRDTYTLESLSSAENGLIIP
jgi:hypothetical protein